MTSERLVLTRSRAWDVARAARRAIPWTRVGIVAGAYLLCVVAFAAFAAWRGANPVTLLPTMLQSSLLQPSALAQTLLRAVPIGFAALAVAVPARAGLVNVGGEGQLIIGAVAATGAGLLVGSHVPGVLGVLLTVAAGALAGGLWAAIGGVLKVAFGAAESVTTLLMNFIANDLMLFLIYQPWKDPNGSGQPQSRPLAGSIRLQPLLGTGVTLAVVLLVAVAIGLWFVIRRTGWGFALRVVGGNPVAAMRNGLPTRRLAISAMGVGGALAGLGGALNLIGVEGQLRPDLTATFGYVGFLACFLGRNDPVRVTLAAILFSAIALSGNGLQISEGLDGSVVNVLLGAIVLTMLSVGRKTAEALT